MAHIPVQCQNCGARYKIPETFQSDSAKCKACGTLIDVKSAREGGDDAAPAAAPAATAKPRATGGTRKPRASAAGSRRKKDEDAEPAAASSSRGSRRRGRGADDEDQPKRGRKAAAAGGGRRSRRGEDDEEEGGGRGRYEKKKDNTPLIAGIVFVALAIVAVVFWQMMDDGAGEGTNSNEKTAGKAEGETKKAGDAEAETKKDGEGKAVDATAKKADAEKKAAEAAAKKKKAAEAKKKKAAIEAAKKKEITKPEDVFKPTSILKPLDRPAEVTEEEEKQCIEYLNDLKGGSGMAFIRAPKKLDDMGWKILPIVFNRMLELDYSKPADSEYAFQLANKVLLPIGKWEFGFRQSKVADDFKLQDGHENALRVKDVRTIAKKFWSSPAGWKLYQKRNPEKFK